jgi:hypothetical protein
VKQLVLDAVSSPLTRIMYARALEDFFAWWTGLGRAAVDAPRCRLVGGPRIAGLAPASVNLRRPKLAAEAAYNGLLDPSAAQPSGIPAARSSAACDRGAAEVRRVRHDGDERARF